MKKFMAWVLGTVITLLFCVPASFAMYIAMGSLLAPELVKVGPVIGIISFFSAVVFYFAGAIAGTGAYRTLLGR
jgi:hypothetical protein